MSNFDIIRAWKDETFRASLSDITLPENPAGQIEISDELLEEIQGGMIPPWTHAIGCTDGTYMSCQETLMLTLC